MNTESSAFGVENFRRSNERPSEHRSAFTSFAALDAGFEGKEDLLEAVNQYSEE